MIRNDIGDEGAKALAQCFQLHHCIRIVDVSYNHIQSTGAMYWSQCVARNKSMTNLDISNNDFDVEGRQLIERGQYARKTRLSALQLVAKGMANNEDTLTVLM